MKKIISLSFLLLLMGAVFAQTDLYSEKPEVQFVKGNITDKIAAVKRSDANSMLAKNAVDFVIANKSLLGEDRDLAGLAVAGILSYPVSEYRKNPGQVLKSFTEIFTTITDINVRVSILDKISAFYSEQENTDLIAFVNSFLLQKISAGGECDETVKKSVETLAKIGNGSSFDVLYSILRQQLWSEIQESVALSLTATADKSLNEITKEINQAELVELKLLSQIYIQNAKISVALKSEIAEKMLNRSMILAGNSCSNDLVSFQLSAASVLAANKWTRAADLAKNYFNVAKIAYEGKYLNEEQFTRAIAYVETLASRGAVAPFSEYLSAMNKAQESGNSPSKTIVLAVIEALGSLGDKSAFDSLLVATYSKYPEEVTVAARNALTRLKW